MTVQVEFTCDDCGATKDTTSLMILDDWEETDDGEDLCPTCSERRRQRGAGAAGGVGCPAC
jgi:DNA-directed RNA polymerase subunit RPC12/RpoP